MQSFSLRLCAILSFFIGPNLMADSPLLYNQVPPLEQLWEIPLETYGFVAFPPSGDKAIYVDKKAITVFHPKTGKKTRQVPHNFNEPYGISCSESAVSVWRSALGGLRYVSSTAKISGANRSVGLKAADPRFSPDGDFLVCATELGPQLFSTDTGDWGKPLAALELDDSVAAAFLDDGKKMFAINGVGAFLIAEVPSGKRLSAGTLPGWPKSHNQFSLRNDGLRPLAVRSADNELFVADGKSIDVYDLNVLPVLDRTLHTSLPARYVDLASTAPVGIALPALSTVQTSYPRGEATGVVFDTRLGTAIGRFPDCQAIASSALSPGGDLLVAVTAVDQGKKKPVKWSIRGWSTKFHDP